MFSKNVLCVKKLFQFCIRRNYMKFNSFCTLPGNLSKQKRKLNSSIEICNRNDFPNIINILNTTYNNEEPLMKALNIKENYILSKYWLNCLEDGNSLKAINNVDNSIIGVSVNCLNSTWSNDHLFELKNKCKAIEMQQIFTIWAMLGQTSELRNKYENCKILELANMAVISAFQSNGLAGKLFQNSFDYGRENCYDVAKVDCTNAFSSKIARKFNMELVWEMSYDELFDIIEISKNKLPKPPHTYIQTYALKLN